MPKRIIPIILIALIIIAIVLTIALAQDPAEKYVSRETILSSEGHPRILMDCVDGRKWARHIPIRIVAVYQEGDNRREAEVDMVPSVDNSYITLHLPPEVASDPNLQGLRLMFQVSSNERCETGYGPGVFTQ